ncbi:MAG: DegT/DnrJ/EryC1/StrS family aminotransferase [Nitrospiraceae bacterium]|nr:DegT/DnrJ/EryC1/StrS family aminotransferase [Nitrospiraceae bacterium]
MSTAPFGANRGPAPKGPVPSGKGTGDKGVRFLPFALPDIGEEEIAEVVEAMRSGWITTGPRTRRFERDFAAFIGDVFVPPDVSLIGVDETPEGMMAQGAGGVEAIAVNSATSGLHLALEAAGIGPGDSVITTPHTFTATAEVVRYLGADPIFVDIDPDTLNIDPARIEQCLALRRQGGKNTVKAIIPVHFGGLPCDMDAILDIAMRHDLKVIEDAAHALPASYKGGLVGSLDSDAAVFSFYATKTITTSEGGMIVTRRRRMANRCRLMRLHGISSDVFERYRTPSLGHKPSWKYEVVAPGFKYNMTDVAASIGIHQLKKAWAFQRRRSEMAERYDEAFSGLPVILPPRAKGADIHSWHLYVIRLCGAKISRDTFIDLMAQKGVGCSVHFIPLHIQPYWRSKYGLRPEDFPQTLRVYEKAVSLPIYTRMSGDDQEMVIRAVRDILLG